MIFLTRETDQRRIMVGFEKEETRIPNYCMYHVPVKAWAWAASCPAAIVMIVLFVVNLRDPWCLNLQESCVAFRIPFDSVSKGVQPSELFASS